MAKWMLMPRRSIHCTWNSWAQSGSAPGAGARLKSPLAHNHKPKPNSRTMVSRAIQRGKVLPKRSNCQHSRPPIKGIRISQGRIIAGYFP